MADCPGNPELESFVVGRLLSEHQESIGLHVSECDSCQQKLERLTAYPEPAGATVPPDQSSLSASESWNNAIAERLARRLHGDITADVDADVESPPEIPGCEIHGVLGRGGMGTVYRAWQTRLERWVAVKTLKTASALDQRAKIRFAREVAAVGRLHHPGIVTAFDANEHQGVHYLLMEHVDGENLSQVLSRVGRLDIPDACEIIRQVAGALQYGHEHDLIHRDVKPSNIMLTLNGQAKLLDLGLARFQTARGAQDDEVTHVGQMMGTVDYMAPEQGEGKRVDVRADVFGLGATCFKLLTGLAPLETLGNASTMNKIATLASGRLPSVGDHRDDLPQALTAIVDRMVAHEASGRFTTAGEVASAIEEFCPGHQLRELVHPRGDHESEPNEIAETQSPHNADVSTSELLAPAKTIIPDAAKITSDAAIPPKSSALQANRRRRGRLVGILTMFGLLILFAAGFTFRIMTDGGEIRITSFDPKVEVEVLHNGKPSADVSAGQLNDYTWYRSGQYEVRLRGELDGIRMSGNQFTVSRGTRHVVTIERIDPPAEEDNDYMVDQHASDFVPSDLNELPPARLLAEYVLSHDAHVDINFDMISHDEVRRYSSGPLPDKPFRINKIVFTEKSTIHHVRNVAEAGVDVYSISFGRSPHVAEEGLPLIAEGLPEMQTLLVPVLDQSGGTADRYAPSIRNMKNLVTLTTIVAADPTSEEAQDATLRWCKVIAELSQVKFAAFENPVPAQGLQMLAKSDSITTVSLNASQLANDDLKLLAAIPNLVNIVLTAPPSLTQVGLQHLVSIPNLQNLRITNAPRLLEPALAEVAQRNPEIEISYAIADGS